MLDHHPDLLLHNSFGFSFPIFPLLENFRLFETRNDLLIAKKAKNAQFFKDYFVSYKNHLEKQCDNYKKPDTTNEAQELARNISNQIELFSILLTAPLPIIKASFGEYSDMFPLINCFTVFPYKRQIEHANTWLPTKDFSIEIEKIEKDFSFFQVKLPSKHEPKSLNVFVSKYIKDCILKDYGYLDGTSLIEIIESLGAGSELRLYKSGIEIPEHLVSNKNQFQQDLSQLSVTGRSFPIENINGYIQINCIAMQNNSDERRLLWEDFSFCSSLIEDELLTPSMLYDHPTIPELD